MLISLFGFQGSPPCPSVWARVWLSFRQGSRRAQRSGDKCVLNNTVLAAACTSESLGSSQGARDPRGCGKQNMPWLLGLGRSREARWGSWGLCWFLHWGLLRGALVPWEKSSWFVLLGFLSGPRRFPATLCSQCLAVLPLPGMWWLCCEMGGRGADRGPLYYLLVK